MPRCVCAVYDHSEDYLMRFSGYIKKRSVLPFSVFAFSSLDALEEFMKKREVDLVLLSAQKDGEIKELAQAVSGFSKAQTQLAVLSEADAAPEQMRCVCKYQSMEGIISEITDILSESEKLRGRPVRTVKTAQITGIYSFGHLDKAVSFALNLAGGGPGQGKALYINLTRFSGLDERLEEPPEDTLSDVIYYFRMKSEKIRGAYMKARGRLGRTDVVSAPGNLEELSLIGEENWRVFLERLMEIAGAQRVILDMGEAFADLAKGFELCERVYLVCSPEEDRARIAQLRKYFRDIQREDLLERLYEMRTGGI